MNKSFLQKIAALLAVVFVCVLTTSGCKGGEDTSESPSLPELTIGVDYYSPAVYRDDDGKFVGLDVELAEEVCRHIGYKPKFVHINWSEKNVILLRGEIDCIWCCFTITGREDDYAWTEPYMNSRQVVAVKENSDITEIADLKEKRVAVQASTKPDEIFSGKAGVQMTIPELKSLNCFPDINYMFAAINEGYVDAIAGHELVLREYMKTSSLKLRVIDESLLDVKVGVAFLKGTNAEIIQKINDTFRILRNNGYMSKVVSAYGLDPNVYLVDYGRTR